MASRRPSPVRFDPQSLDATLARILSAQQAHGEEMRQSFAETRTELLAIKEQAIRTNGRVTMLEFWRETSKAKMAGIAAGLGAAGGIATWLAGILIRN